MDVVGNWSDHKARLLTGATVDPSPRTGITPSSCKRCARRRCRNVRSWGSTAISLYVLLSFCDPDTAKAHAVASLRSAKRTSASVSDMR